MASRAVRTHSAITRVTHWLTLPAFAMLFATGAAMFNHKPHFRIGNYQLDLPRIPSWLAIGVIPKPLHYIFSALFVACGVAYLTWGLRSGHFRTIVPSRRDLRSALPMARYYLGLQPEPPTYGRYNPLQQIAYSALLFVVTPLIVLSGTAMLPFHILRPIGIIFVGGVKLWHFGLMWLVCLFGVGHVFMVTATGLWANLRPMLGNRPAHEVA